MAASAATVLRSAQHRLATAAHELQRLHGEFDLANAAAAELDVVTVTRAPRLLADLAMHVAQAVVGVEVEILAIHERHDHGFELVARGAGHRARLEPRVAFPRAALRHQVLLEAGERQRQRAAVAVGTQSHVDAEHEAVDGGIRQRTDDAPAEAVEELAVGDRPRAVGVALVRIDEHEIDVRRHVELAAAELAEGEDVHRLPCAVGGGARLAERRGEVVVVQAQCGGDRAIRQGGHHREDLGQRRGAGQVARQRVQHHTLAQAAQRCMQRIGIDRIDERLERRQRMRDVERRVEGGGELVAQCRLRGDEAGGVVAEAKRALEVHGGIGWRGRAGHPLQSVDPVAHYARHART